MKRLVITEEAEKDLVEIELFINIFSTQSQVKKVFDKIFKKFDLLCNFPMIGQIESERYRYVVSIDYKIVYSVEDGEIVVKRVFDTRQDPKKLKI